MAVTIYLRTLDNTPDLDRVFTLICRLSLGLAFFSLTPWSVLGSELLGSVGIILFGLAGVASVLTLKNSRRVTGYYFVSWLVISTTILWFSLKFFGVFQLGLNSEITVLLGCGLGILLFSLGLADRYHHLKHRIEGLHRLQIQQISAHSLSLESALNERTKRLKAEQQDKEKFFSIIAHDLRGPMGSLTVSLESMNDGVFEPDQSGIEVCAAASRKVLEKLESLLTWSQSQQGRLTPVPTTLEVISQLLIPCADILEPLASAKNIRLVVSSDDPAWIFADPNMMETVLRNIVSNSIKFSEPGTQIELSVNQKADNVHICIQDQGVGFNQEQFDQLFCLEGVSLSTKGTTAEPGSGMGLLLCKEFVENNNGQISVESALGVGSKVNLKLPYAEIRPKAPEGLPLQGENVLFLGMPSPADQQAQILLDQFGAQSHFAENLGQATPLLQRSEYRMIFFNGDSIESIQRGLKGHLQNHQKYYPSLIQLTTQAHHAIPATQKTGAFLGQLPCDFSWQQLQSLLKDLPCKSTKADSS